MADVYKRQVEMGDQAQGGLVLSARTCGDMRADIGVLGHVAVSYTHLDVYKRQP